MALASAPSIAFAGDQPAARFDGEVASADVRDTANWVVTSHDNHALPFVVIDKVNAKVFVFDKAGALRGAAPALLGMARGDDSVPGIGQRKLATITPAERTTPAGRFEASLGQDFDQDILWIDYNAALSMHRVIVGRKVDNRAGRLASATASDNRISYGCVNVPAKFYDDIVKPMFVGTVGIVYILPETKPLRTVFAVPIGAAPIAAAPTASASAASIATPG
ncbi:L,D-transpeptidase [Sphingomonas sp. M1A8_2b]